MPIYWGDKIAVTEGSNKYNIEKEVFELKEIELEILEKLSDIKNLYEHYPEEVSRLKIFGSISIRIKNEKIDETKIVDETSPLGNIGTHSIIESYDYDKINERFKKLKG